MKAPVHTIKKNAEKSIAAANRPADGKTGNALQKYSSVTGLQQQQKAGQSVAQLFPYTRKNTRTNRTFQITNTGGQLEAVQTGGDKDDLHYGYATYRINDDNLELGHIASDPEEGSGIGSLLMYFLAEIAAQNGLRYIIIPTAAPTAVSFYELLGYESTNLEGTAKMESALEEDKDSIETAITRYAELRARVEYDSDPENHKLKRRGFSLSKTQLSWRNLKEGEQQELIKQQHIKFNKKSKIEQDRIIKSMLHGRAVGQYGMVGKVRTLLGRAEQQCARWVDPDAWTQEEINAVWESRKDPTTLTEFPRRHDD